MTVLGIQALVAHVILVIAGMKKRFPNGSQVLSFGGGTHTVDEVMSALQALVALRAAVDQADAATQVARDAEAAGSPPLLLMLRLFTQFLHATFGTTADALADFDLTPPKAPAPRTAEQKAIATAKARATREARGTASAKKKRNVKGNVTAKLVVTPGPRPLLRRRCGDGRACRGRPCGRDAEGVAA